jgi:hypothetical protein
MKIQIREKLLKWYNNLSLFNLILLLTQKPWQIWIATIAGLTAIIIAIVDRILKPLVFPERITIISEATGVDYTQLRDLLAKKKWEKADQETVNLMLKVVHKEKEGSFEYEDMNYFPCYDLNIINQLWIRASDEKFGFSVQKDIYANSSGDEYDRLENLGNLVGWFKNGHIIEYSDLTFDLNKAPSGHFPAKLMLTEGMGDTSFIYKDLMTCGVHNYGFHGRK